LNINAQCLTTSVGSETTAASWLVTDADEICIDDSGMQATQLDETDDLFQVLAHPSLQMLLSSQPGAPADVSESPATPHAELPPPTPLPVDDQQQEVVAITQQDTSCLINPKKCQPKKNAKFQPKTYNKCKWKYYNLKRKKLLSRLKT
jgi:hypothetical protein